MKRYRQQAAVLVVLTAVCIACQPVSGVPAGEPAAPTSSPTVAPAPAETLTATPFPAPATPAPTVPPTSPTAATTPSPPAATPAATSTPLQSLERPDAVARAVDDLSRRLGAEPAAVEVVSVTADEFPLQNLGCPTGPIKEEPVLPAFVVGQIIHLRVGDDVYEYRAHGVRVVFCGKQ